MANEYRPLHFPDGSGGWDTVGDPRLGDEIDGMLTDAKGYTDQEVATRAPTIHDHPATDISDSTALGRTLMAVADAQAGRTALDITVDTSVGTRVLVGGVMVHGDTGWRDMSALLPPTLKIPSAAPRLALRRADNVVTLSGRLEVTAALAGVDRLATLAVLDPLPVGFRVASVAAYGIHGQATTGRIVMPVTTLSNNGRIDIRYGTGQWEAGDIITLYATWAAENAWPTTLPGTPV